MCLASRRGDAWLATFLRLLMIASDDARVCLCVCVD